VLENGTIQKTTIGSPPNVRLVDKEVSEKQINQQQMADLLAYLKQNK
jgi:hypothetical protein